MKINKIKINKDKLDANFKLYLFLKELNGNIKLSDNDIALVLEAYHANKQVNFEKHIEILKNTINRLNETKALKMLGLILQITNTCDLETFIFAIKLIQIKPLLLAEAKINEIAELSKLEDNHQLSLAYDTISKSRPYYTRVNGALLSLLFFAKLEEKDSSFLAESTHEYINSLFIQYDSLVKQGLEPNQMFMLMFSESVNQSIISDAGSNYEDRIYNILIGLGIPSKDISKIHDSEDSSTEFDFFFRLNNKTFGIGAKRTLRERYKQFIKTAQMSKINVMIEITLGLDLTHEKALSIRKHGVYLFIADEIYNARKDLQSIDGIYPASKLELSLLKKLSN